MQKRIDLIVVSCFLLFSAVPVMAQNSTNSPYTYYGYGELANRSFGAGRSMGGAGIGLRSPNQINPMNPASYSSMDSLTFLFDFGASAQRSWYKDGANKQKNTNGNVEYMAMQFPVHKNIAMSAGLLPYSHVGYNIEGLGHIGDQQYLQVFEGEGGLNHLYAGLSIEIWKKRLSVGANVNYFFGTISHTSTTIYGVSGATNTEINNRLKINSSSFDLGLQYSHPLSKTDNIVFGVALSPKKRLNNNYYETVGIGSEVNIDTITGLSYDKPFDVGFGLSYVKENKYIAAVDLSYQKWSKASFAGKSNEFKDRLKISAGVEYIHDFYSRQYFDRIKYRLGMNYSNSYVQIDDNGYKEYGATLGASFPVGENRSYVNLSFEYVKVKPEYKSITMVDENYLRMTLSFTFNESWFLKTKVK